MRYRRTVSNSLSSRVTMSPPDSSSGWGMSFGLDRVRVTGAELNNCNPEPSHE